MGEFISIYNHSSHPLHISWNEDEGKAYNIILYYGENMNLHCEGEKQRQYIETLEIKQLDKSSNVFNFPGTQDVDDDPCTKIVHPEPESVLKPEYETTAKF